MKNVKLILRNCLSEKQKQKQETKGKLFDWQSLKKYDKKYVCCQFLWKALHSAARKQNIIANKISLQAYWPGVQLFLALLGFIDAFKSES